MKLYILRHEDRTQDATFFAPLTKTGLDNSLKLIAKCDELHIKNIHSNIAYTIAYNIDKLNIDVAKLTEKLDQLLK